MYSKAQTEFIRKLAQDCIEVHEEQNKQNPAPVAPKLVADPHRVVGHTDYSKFDNIADTLSYEEELTKYTQEQKSAAEWCKLDHVHGPQCKQPNRGGSTCSHDRSQERSIYEKPYDEKIKAIILFREEGNAAFKDKKFQDALVAYKRAMVYLDYAFGDTPEQEDELDGERLKVHLNLAAAYLELEEYSKTVNECRLAIKLDSGNSKAFYRSGMAHLRLGELEEAQSDLYQALKLVATGPKDMRLSVENAIHELNVKVREYKKKSKAIAKASLKNSD